jgi:hypothetical protein
MAKIVNNFIKGRMNKDLDDRLVPQGEYRNSVNTQISKSEGQNVGALENSIGNTVIKNADFRTILGVNDLVSIGVFPDETNNRVFVFLTNKASGSYDPTAQHFLMMYDVGADNYSILLKATWLNFAISNPITGVNLLENLLFWTDNRNQPRVINVDTAINDTGFYKNEDLVSVSKYYPYQPIELYRHSADLTSTVATPNYETTMYDVTSLSYPDGGSGKVLGAWGGATNLLDLDKGTIDGTIRNGMKVAYVDSVLNKIVDTGTTVSAVNYAFSATQARITTLANVSPSGNDVVFAFEFNPYYEEDYAGDKDFLKKKLARFAYRFKYNDGEYSIFSPFTQDCFIPKQDGYFMYDVENVDGSASGPSAPIPIDITDEEDTYRSTTVEFMENKVDKIILRIPLPADADNLVSNFNISELDILYKESDGIAVNVIDTIPVSRIVNQSGITGVVNPGATGTVFTVTNLTGTPRIGSIVTDNLGQITDFPTLLSINSLGQITLSSTQTLAINTVLTFGEANIFEYEYESKKPYKVLPEADLLRTYDKVPVKALSQEIISNRVVYGNFQDKHTPPASLNYNLGVSAKENFSLGLGTAQVDTAGYSSGVTTIPYNAATLVGYLNNGAIITGPGIPNNTVIVSFNPLGTIEISNATTGAGVAGNVLNFSDPGTVQDTTSVVEYPNHTLKQNRNYQVGVVLSDKYGRQSTVVLSSEEGSTSFNNELFKGSTIFSDYIDEGVNQLTWPGNSLKVLFNEGISPSTANPSTLWPGIYNGDSSSADYNPLGWYSYKIVVKQTEQEYYNVYLPGIMAAYPEDPTKELNKTSHTVLINDNINKVPRDLTEVGPEQKLFRSSVILHGRVQNLNSSVVTENNSQFYPGNFDDIVSVIATDDDLFNGNDVRDFTPATEFYSVASNPLIARITTPSKKIGIPAVLTTSNITGYSAGNREITVSNVSPCTAVPSACIVAGMNITGPGIPPGTIIEDASVGGINNFKISQAANPDTSGASLYTYSPTQIEATSGGTKYVNMPQLAVMETDPVESNLDIYWETSTAGLISELNEAIANDTASAVDFSSFNTSAFTEALAVGGNILSANFYLVDQFNNTIPYSVTTPAQLQLISVVDGAGNTIGIGPGNQFELITIGSGPSTTYNIRFNGVPVPSSPPDALYYKNNFNLNTYVFEFLATINGVGTTLVKAPVNLQNETPVIGSKACPGNLTWNGGDPTSPITGAIVSFRNGSSGLTVYRLGMTADFTVVNSSGVDFKSSFAITTSDLLNEFVVQLGFNGSATVPDDVYTVVITATDAGAATVSCSFNLTVSNSICRKYTFTVPGGGATVNYTGCAGGGPQVNTYLPADAGPQFLCSETIPTSTPTLTFTDAGSC